MQGENPSTFIIHISKSDNASWQGQVTWADRSITRSFRSALELIKMMDGVVQLDELN